MNLNTQLNVSYDYGTEQFTCAWQVRNGEGRTADFSFSIGLDFDKPTYRATWQRPDGTKAVIDQTVRFEELSPADKARALLIGEAGDSLTNFRDRIYERMGGSRIIREGFVQEYMGGNLKETTGPFNGNLEIRNSQGKGAFEALFQEMAERVV